MKSKEDVFLEVLEMYEKAMRTVNRLVYDGDGKDVIECVNKNIENAVKHMIQEYKEAK